MGSQIKSSHKLLLSSEHGTNKNVKARFWPWLSGSPWKLLRYPLFGQNKKEWDFRGIRRVLKLRLVCSKTPICTKTPFCSKTTLCQLHEELRTILTQWIIAIIVIICLSIYGLNFPSLCTSNRVDGHNRLDGLSNLFRWTSADVFSCAVARGVADAADAVDHRHHMPIHVRLKFPFVLYFKSCRWT